jgi:hypothetical protein
MPAIALTPPPSKEIIFLGFTCLEKKLENIFIGIIVTLYKDQSIKKGAYSPLG